MQRRRTFVLTALAVTLLGSAMAAGVPQEGGDLVVTVSYTGKVKVDATHQIWVFLFDSPDIGEGSQPLAVQAVPKSGGVATFKGLVKDTVYIAMAFDEKGGYDGTSGPPPPGTPVAIHIGETPGAAAPVKVGKGSKVKVSFDDSIRFGQGS